VTGQSLVQRSPKKCDVSECDPKTSIMRRPRATLAVISCGKEKRESSGNVILVYGSGSNPSTVQHSWLSRDRNC
jgi:hypothetical protein